MSTLCPGKNLISWIKRYRNNNKENDLTKKELLKIIEEQRITIKEKNKEIGKLKTKSNSLTIKLGKCKTSKKELKVAMENQRGWFSKQIKKFFKDEYE